MRGPVTIQGVPDPCGGPGLRGGPDFHGRSGTPGCSAERLLLPEHVVLPGLSQPGTGPGPLLGEQGFRSAGVRPLDVVKDDYKALLA